MSSCSCLRDLLLYCNESLSLPHSYAKNGAVHVEVDEVGRIAYTVAILMIFAFIIIILMFRSIKRSSSTVEMEALLDAMRFREELDLQQRQRRRLLKAKTKVSAWLTKTNTGDGRLWKSSPMLLPRKMTATTSVASELPEIVVTEEMHRAHTPALSLIYDFDRSSRTSIASTGPVFSPSNSLDESSSSRRKSPLLPLHRNP